MYVNQIYNEHRLGSDISRQRFTRRQRFCIGVLIFLSISLLLTLALILAFVVFKPSDDKGKSSTTATNNYTDRTLPTLSLSVQTTTNTFAASRSEISTTTSSSSTTSARFTVTSTTSDSTSTTSTTSESTSTTSTTSESTSTTSTTSESTSTTSTTTASTKTKYTTATTTAVTTIESTTFSTSTTTVTTTTPDRYRTCQNGFKLIHFDDLPSNETLIPMGYQGLNWTNAGAFNISKYGASGYRTVLTSTPNVAYNGGGNPMLIGVGPSASVKSFSVQSFIVAAAWSNNLKLTLAGYRGSTAVYNHTITLQTTSKVLLSLNWINMTRMGFSTSGGVTAGYEESGPHVGIDNMCVLTSTA